MRLSAAIWRVEAPLRAGDGQADRGGLERGPDAAAQGRGDHLPLLGRDAFGECRAPCGCRRRCRSPCRSSMMSNRPAEHSDGDRSTRNAAFGAEIIRFRAIRGHLGPERPLPRRCRTPGRLRRLRRHVAHVLRVRQRPARHQRQRPHRAARPRSRRFGAQRTFASRRSFDARPEMRHTIDS